MRRWFIGRGRAEDFAASDEASLFRRGFLRASLLSHTTPCVFGNVGTHAQLIFCALVYFLLPTLFCLIWNSLLFSSLLYFISVNWKDMWLFNISWETNKLIFHYIYSISPVKRNLNKSVHLISCHLNISIKLFYAISHSNAHLLLFLCYAVGCGSYFLQITQFLNILLMSGRTKKWRKSEKGRWDIPRPGSVCKKRIRTRKDMLPLQEMNSGPRRGRRGEWLVSDDQHVKYVRFNKGDLLFAMAQSWD